MSARILLLRHAVTAAPHLFHGAESDIELGPEGREQAEKLAAELIDQQPDALYSSAMARAIQTAEPIAALCGLKTTILPMLHERSMGNLSGTSWVMTYPIHDQTMKAWEEGDLDATHASGESYRQIHDRVIPLLRKIATDHQGQTVVVVAHGMVIRVLVSSLILSVGTHQIRRIPIEHARIIAIREKRGEWVLEEELLPRMED